MRSVDRGPWTVRTFALLASIFSTLQPGDRKEMQPFRCAGRNPFRLSFFLIKTFSMHQAQDDVTFSSEFNLDVCSFCAQQQHHHSITAIDKSGLYMILCVYANVYTSSRTRFWCVVVCLTALYCTEIPPWRIRARKVP